MSTTTRVLLHPLANHPPSPLTSHPPPPPSAVSRAAVLLITSLSLSSLASCLRHAASEVVARLRPTPSVVLAVGCLGAGGTGAPGSSREPIRALWVAEHCSGRASSLAGSVGVCQWPLYRSEPNVTVHLFSTALRIWTSGSTAFVDIFTSEGWKLIPVFSLAVCTCCVLIVFLTRKHL